MQESKSGETLIGDESDCGDTEFFLFIVKLVKGVIKLFHDEIGVLFEFLHFQYFGEIVVVGKTEHDLELFFDEDHFLDYQCFTFP